MIKLFYGVCVCLSTSFLSYGQNICQALYYPFKSNAQEASGTGINGRVYNSILTSDRKGNPGNAYLFDGSTAYIDLGNNELLRRYQTDFTIAAWVYLKSYSEDYRSAIVSNRDTNSIGSGFSIGGLLNDPGKVKLEVQGGGNATAAISKSVLELNKWYFVAVTFTYNGGNNNSANIYINNNLETTSIVSDVQLPVSTPTFIGHEPSKLVSPLNHFNGIIDEVRIFNCVLSKEEISQYYFAGTLVTAVSSASYKKDLYVFPNPATEEVTVNARQEGVYLVMNQMGQIVKREILNESNGFSINISSLPNGIYTISAECNTIPTHTRLEIVK